MKLIPLGQFAVGMMLMSAWVASAAGSDDAHEALFVIYQGRRVPTVVLPPERAGRNGAQPALEVVDAGPARSADFEPGDDAYGVADEADDDDAPRAPRGALRSVIGRYAGYPVSLRYGWPGDGYYGGYPPAGYGRVLDEIYRAEEAARQRERERRFNLRDMRQRKQRVLASHEKALRLGLEHLRDGNYAQAVVALQMAAELNQGDPACRIHLAQARLAQGHYREAAQALRRALQLQDKLVYVTLDLGSYCADPADFERQVDRLAGWVKEHRDDGDAQFLLGYMEFQREHFERAYAAFRQAARLTPKDTLVAAYLKITKPAAK